MSKAGAIIVLSSRRSPARIISLDIVVVHIRVATTPWCEQYYISMSIAIVIHIFTLILDLNAARWC